MVPLAPGREPVLARARRLAHLRRGRPPGGFHAHDAARAHPRPPQYPQHRRKAPSGGPRPRPGSPPFQGRDPRGVSQPRALRPERGGSGRGEPHLLLAPRKRAHHAGNPHAGRDPAEPRPAGAGEARARLAREGAYGAGTPMGRAPSGAGAAGGTRLRPDEAAFASGAAVRRTPPHHAAPREPRGQSLPPDHHDAGPAAAACARAAGAGLRGTRIERRDPQRRRHARGHARHGREGARGLGGLLRREDRRAGERRLRTAFAGLRPEALHLRARPGPGPHPPEHGPARRPHELRSLQPGELRRPVHRADSRQGRAGALAKRPGGGPRGEPRLAVASRIPAQRGRVAVARRALPRARARPRRRRRHDGGNRAPLRDPRQPRRGEATTLPQRRPRRRRRATSFRGGGLRDARHAARQPASRGVARGAGRGPRRRLEDGHLLGIP